MPSNGSPSPLPVSGEAPPSGALPGPPRSVPGSDVLELTRTSRPVAPGVRLSSFSRLEPGGWQRADALSVNLSSGPGDSRAEYLSSGEVSEPRRVSELTAGHDAGEGRRTVAAVNADFFDIGATGAPLGPGVRAGGIPHSPASGRSEAVGIDPGAAGRVLGLYFHGTANLAGKKHRLSSYNAANVPTDGIGVYTPQWGSADRALTTDGSRKTAELTLRDGKVVSRTERPGKRRVPRGSSVLVGSGKGARALERLKRGDRVAVEYRLRTEDGSPTPRTAVGGRGALVVDGVPQDWSGKPNNQPAPRTAVGFSQDGGTMHMLTVDGRQAVSRGVTLTRLAQMMRELGAHNALNLDGGGSSILLARQPGGKRPRLENAPSEGTERAVPNGLAVTAPEGSGRLAGYWVETAIQPTREPADSYAPTGHRVFPGLTRALTANGHDETYGPAGGAPRWRSERPSVGHADDRGVFHARRSGSTEVTAWRGGAEGATELHVLGELARIEPTDTHLGLADATNTGSFSVVGSDAEGVRAPIEPADVRLDYDRSLFRVTPVTGASSSAGSFRVTPRPGTQAASGSVTVSVGGRTARLAVTVGLRDEVLTDFDGSSGPHDPAHWRFEAARAEGALRREPRGRTGAGLHLAYDFSQSSGTRAAYAVPRQPIETPGQPRAYRLWVRGDGLGAWPSLQLKDGNGNRHTLRGPHIDWTGWRRVSFDVPSGLTHPLRVERLYLAETRADHRYRGEVVFDELAARTTPTAELPSGGRPQDPVISTASDVGGRDWRFAVLSDAQFTARAPRSEQVRQARRTLREVRAARPDFVVVNGDLVDEGSPRDLRFARRLLDEELGGAVRWFYVPGNHEVMGGSIATFQREIGPARQAFDHRGTRFIALDTSSLTLRGGGFGQFLMLRRQLEAAGRDPSVRSVAVLQHVPPRDPTPPHASQLTDRMEAVLLENWLGGFRARTGKGAALIGAHTGYFNASRVNGVPYLLNGNSGKSPSTSPADGGFTGWSLIGVDQLPPAHDPARKPPRQEGRHPGDRGPDWLSVQTRPHTDGLTLTVPERLRTGETSTATATVLQGKGRHTRDVPVDWPVSADWSGSPNLCVRRSTPGTVPRPNTTLSATPWGAGRPGPTATPRPPRPHQAGKAGQAGRRCAASFDPRTRELIGHRPGTVTLTVTVNGERAQRVLRIER